MLQPNDLPLVCLPTELSGAAAAKLVEFLYAIAEALERHYYAEIHAYYHPDGSQCDFDRGASPADPPF